MFKPEEMPLPPEINASAWKEWCADRKERRKPMTQRAAIMTINKLSPFSYAEQAQAVCESIEHGWTGLFPKKAPMTFIDRHSDTSWRNDADKDAFIKRITDRSWADGL